MFSDDPQMTPIMRHLEEFSGVTAISVTNPLRKLIEFYSQICSLSPQSDEIFFFVTDVSFTVLSFIFLPLDDPQAHTSTAHSTLSTAAFVTPPLHISASRLRVSKTGTSDILATYSYVYNSL